VGWESEEIRQRAHWYQFEDELEGVSYGPAQGTPVVQAIDKAQLIVHMQRAPAGGVAESSHAQLLYFRVDPLQY